MPIGDLAREDTYGDQLIPPPYLKEPQMGAGPALGDLAAQPFRDIAKGLGGGMTEDEAKDYAFWGALGLARPGRAAGSRTGACAVTGGQAPARRASDTRTDRPDFGRARRGRGT
jgi:hypothetical protein